MDLFMVDEGDAYREAMLAQGDYDEVSLKECVFGFTTFGSKQKQCRIIPCIGGRKKRAPKSQHQQQQQPSMTEFEDGDDVNNLENFYERFSLVKCEVNVFAMKKFIRQNIKSLREIKIEDCRFYLADEDAFEQRNQVMNQRMLQELNFVWLIEQFKFQDIMSIDIKLVKEQFSDKATAVDLKRIFKRKSAKVMAMNFANDKQPGKVKRKSTDFFTHHNMENYNTDNLTESQLKEYFAFSEDSKFLEYELNEKKTFNQTYQKEQLKNLAQDLIWGDVQDQERFIDKYYDNTLIDIQQNLAIYKKYTKYAFNDGKLAIIGDVMYNGMSLNQLYNLIQLNCTQINGIIFKDNGKIPPKAFSDLMKQIFLIPSLEQISFLSSVLDESSLQELQYLIEKKDVRFLNLYRSYFLKSELSELMKIPPNSKYNFNINHHRFVVIDIAQKKSYEFTPFSFNLGELKQKKRENLLEVQRLYSSQMYYPKQVYNQIVFFQGMNLSIINQNGSEKILFKYWDLLNKTKDEQKVAFQSKQDELIQILDDQFREDDVNLLNFSLVKLLISLVIEKEQQRTFNNLMNESKSFKLLKESFAIKVVEKITFEKLQYLETAYAYIYGFTRIKEVSLIYVFNNKQLYRDVRENNQEYAKHVRDENSALMLKESFTDDVEAVYSSTSSTINNNNNSNSNANSNAHGITDKQSESTLMQIKAFVDFKSMVELRLENITDVKASFTYLNDVLVLCTNLKIFSLANSMLNNEKIADVKFELVPSGLEHFDISMNKNLDSLKFMDKVFRAAKDLKVLKLNDLQMKEVKVKSITWSLIPNSLESLDLSANVIKDVGFLSSVFARTIQLKKLNLAKTSLNDVLFTQIRFPNSMKEIVVSSNTQLSLDTVLVHLGKVDGMAIEVIEAFRVKAKDTFDAKNKDIQLNAFTKLKKLELQHNDLKGSECVNLVLANSKSLRDLEISEQELTAAAFREIKFKNCFETLEVLDLSYGQTFEDFKFLNDVFAGVKVLKVLNLSHSAVSDTKMPEAVFANVPRFLQRFIFSGNNTFDNFKALLNSLFARCVDLRELRIDECDLDDEKLEDVEFYAISSTLEVFDISKNPKIVGFNFLNSVFRRARNLKEINLKSAKIEKVNDIMFDLLSDTVEVFQADEVDEKQQHRGFFDDEFQDWLVNKLERYMNISGFMERHSNVYNRSFINYFGVFEQQNLSQYRQGSEGTTVFLDTAVATTTAVGALEDNKMTESVIIPMANISSQFGQNSMLGGGDTRRMSSSIDPMTPSNKLSDEEVARQKKKRISEWKEMFKIQGADDWVSNSSDVKYSKHPNVMFFYSVLKKLDQLVNNNGSSNEGNNAQRMNLGVLIEKIVEQQNVYNSKDYALIQFIDMQMMKNHFIDAMNQSSQQLDYDMYFQALKVIDMSGQKYQNLDFLSFFLENGHQIVKIDMSNMDLTAAVVGTIKMSSSTVLPMLESLTFAGNKCTSQSNIFEFVEKVISIAPRLKSLCLSNMEMHDAIVCDLRNISDTLEVLDISNNSRIPSLDCLNAVLSKCKGLLKLNVSNTGIDETKLKGVDFSKVSSALEEFDCSNNENQNLKTIEFINQVIVKCQSLKKLNMSRCGIDWQTNPKIQYANLSKSCEEINISANVIVYDMECVGKILARCPTLKKLDLSGQIHSNQFIALPLQFQKNSLQEFDFSGNTIFNTYEFIPAMISESNAFRRLTIRNVNLTFERLKSFCFDSIGRQIAELDISDNLDITDVSLLNELGKNEEQPLTTLIANGTSLNTEMMKDIYIHQVFVNLKRLELANNVYFVRLDFINDIFLAASKLEVLRLAGMQMTQKQFEEINFLLTPKTLVELDFSENPYITDFKNLSDLFEVTAASLRQLSLRKCDLVEAKLKNTKFERLSKQIEVLDIAENENLMSIEFIKKIFENSPGVRMKEFRISKSTYEIAFVLQQYCSQIEKIVCPFQRLDFEFFAKKQSTVNLNLIKFLQYLLANNNFSKFQNPSATQLMFKSGDAKGKIFKELLKQIMEFKSQMKPLQTILHFFFLLVNEDRLLSKSFESEFFVMSPYSFFSQPHAIECAAKTDSTPANKPSAEMIIDSYNLCFFDMNLLHQQTDYIFSYDKFFFSEFPDFYVQDLQEKHADLRFMVRLKAKMDKYGVSNAFLPIRLQLTPDALKALNLSEFQVLNLINFIPPAVMNLKGMSIQFVKSWYAINFYAPLSVNTLIDVDYDLLENSSIANFLTLRSYRLYIQNFEAKTFTSRMKMLFGYFCYSFFNVLSSQPKQYRFDHTVIHLENRFKLDALKGRYSILRLLFPVYLFVCIFGVWYFSFKEDIECGKGLAWYSYYTYAVFGVITFFIEAYIFLVCLKYVPHLVPELKPDCRISFPYPMINGIKTFIMDVWWINQWYVNYVISFLLSQLSRFDFFTNLGFLFTTYQCGDYLIFLLALISNGITLFSNIVFFFMNFIGDDTYGRLVTGQIDRLYQICNLLEFQAVADVLDIVSPSNSVIIFGKMFNQRIVNNFIRIIFQDVPLIVIQALYLVRSGAFSSTMLFSLISSGLMFLVSLKKFLTITPSRLGQEDFNELNVIKKRKVLPNYLKKLSDYESKVVAFNQYESIKCVKSTTYFENVLKSQSVPAKDIKKQILMAKELREFEPNAEFIHDFFGDSKFNDQLEPKEQSPQQQQLLSAGGANRKGSGDYLNGSPKETGVYGLIDQVNEQDDALFLIETTKQQEPLQKQNSLMSIHSIRKLAGDDDVDHKANEKVQLVNQTPSNGQSGNQQNDPEQQSREQMLPNSGMKEVENKNKRESLIEEKQNYQIMFGDKKVIKKQIKKGKKR